MMRKGMSFTLTLLIVAMVLLAVGITIITLGQNSIGSVGDIFRGSTGDSEVDIARQNCNQERQRICRQRTLELWINQEATWAEQAVHEGKSCSDWAEQDLIYGGGGTDAIPDCQQEPSRQEKIDRCTDAVTQFCSGANSGQPWNQASNTSRTESSSEWSSSVPQICTNFQSGIGGPNCGDVS